MLRGVQFDLDKADIRPDAGVILDEAANQLGQVPGARVSVEGHTDSTGSDAYNQSLSERRASSVKDYLVGKGVEIVSPPEQSPRGHWLFFVKDFDGNLIEITDLGKMYYVLGWLGPLGGWLFRRGMYKAYYS